MSYIENIKTDLCKYLKSIKIDCVEVTSFNDSTQWGGYCETCAYESVCVDIYYTNSKGKGKNYTYDEGLSDLLYALDNLE